MLRISFVAIILWQLLKNGPVMVVRFISEDLIFLIRNNVTNVCDTGINLEHTRRSNRILPTHMTTLMSVKLASDKYTHVVDHDPTSWGNTATVYLATLP